MRWMIPLVLLAGCAATGPSTGLPPLGAADTCGASVASRFVGQPESALVGVEFEGPVRIVGPNDAVTLDYNPERLTITLDGNGRIARASCG